MKTIKIRDVRGSLIEELAQSTELVGITSNRVLVGVLCPISRAWLEHVVEMNFSRLQQNIARGEAEIAAGRTGATLAEALVEGGDTVAEPAVAGSGHGPLAVPGVDKLIATMASVREALLPTRESAAGRGAGALTSRTVRLGDLSHSVIEEAGKAGQMLAVTNDHVLVGIIAPVTEELVAHLVEQRLSAVMYNVGRGERDVAHGRTYSLDDVLAETSQDPEASPSAVKRPLQRGR
ncbi:MAG TPA: hypothetical protein VIW24_00380 [Aldersonia sp.]